VIGILALQGDYAAHGAILAQLGYDWREVRTTSELQSVDGLILPGGESGALLRLMDDELFLALSKFEKPIFGTCAGAILLASKVSNPEQKSLGKIDIDIQRNGYGRQLDSF
jgi:5'-phosphate synthase pdxT subunit